MTRFIQLIVICLQVTCIGFGLANKPRAIDRTTK